MNDISLFCQLSQTLTGFDILPEKLASEHWYNLINNEGYKDILPKLISQYEAILDKPNAVLDSIRDNTEIVDLPKLIKGVIFLWYTGELIPWGKLDLAYGKDQKSTIKSPTEYYNGLLWKAIHAHPPGLSGGYFGYWKYEPEF